MPTPSPALNETPLPGAVRRNVVMISAEWVTSGSSPASLMIAAIAQPSPSRLRDSAKRGAWPPGRVTVTGSGKSPVSSAV